MHCPCFSFITEQWTLFFLCIYVCIPYCGVFNFTPRETYGCVVVGRPWNKGKQWEIWCGISYWSFRWPIKGMHVWVQSQREINEKYKIDGKMMATRGRKRKSFLRKEQREWGTKTILGVRVKTSNYHYLAMTVYISIVKGVGMVHCKENPNYVFLFWELCGLSPDSTFMCLWAIYIFLRLVNTPHISL
jgi:hypothetical protein